LTRAYLKSVDVGGPWAIAALDRLAEWTREFADDVDRISPPGKLDPKALEQFKKTLKSISQRLREQARETWKRAYREAEKQKILSPAMPRVIDRLLESGELSIGWAQGFHGGSQLLEEFSKSLSEARHELEKPPQNPQAWSHY